jgi:hypothetical protein
VTRALKRQRPFTDLIRIFFRKNQLGVDSSEAVTIACYIMKFEEIFYNKEGNNAEKYNTEENILYLSIKKKEWIPGLGDRTP